MSTVVSRQTVRIERHDFGNGLAALTFADPIRLESETGEDSLPLVFVLHGLGSRKERHLDACLRLARVGFLACAVDARHHGERWSEASAILMGERTTLAFARTFMDAVLGTRDDVLHLVNRWERDRYAILGHSMGGFIALHIALADARRCAAVSCVSGSIDVRPPSGITVTPEIEAGIALADPVANVESLWPCALSLMHGDSDETVPLAGALRLYNAAYPLYASDPDRLALDVLPGVGHEFTPAMAERAVAWLTRFVPLKGEPDR